jgi:dTDP-4-amino-4,6-dideoxygalactose transaminase
VIVPSLSWSTTVWPLIQSSLIPVFVDCDPKTFNFDLNKLEAAITPKTKAIMLVHVYGNPCDMDALMAIAKKHNLQVIEDTCESMGAYYKGKAVGTFGRCATFSFYFSHHITTLEGGITVTDDFSIFIEESHHFNRKRFTLAHELGHYFLHNEIIKSDGIYIDNKESLMFRGLVYSEEEHEANMFAAEYLMPENEVRKLYNKY